MAAMIPVEEARRRILDSLPLLPAEVVPITDALGRALAEDVTARVTQPPADVSAMDGYAARAADIEHVPARLTVVGEAAAGGRHSGTVGPGEAVRIFTGGPVPDGADTIVIQENTEREGDAVVVRQSAPPGRHIRAAGLDFRGGETGIPAPRKLTVRDVGLAAAMNVPWLKVRRRPRVAILATGDEIVLPGEPIGASQIVSSNSLVLAALISAAGGEPVNLGVAADNRDSLARMAEAARGTDFLVSTGGVSVGEHDLVQSVLADVGFEMDFWRVAMRPGKPVLFGKLGATPVLGLPGNPVSTLVCGLVFLWPALAAMTGLDAAEIRETARLGTDLRPNDQRQEYLRAECRRESGGRIVVPPFSKQDSSMLSILARAQCLIVRPPFAPEMKAGDAVEIIPFPAGPFSI